MIGCYIDILLQATAVTSNHAVREMAVDAPSLETDDDDVLSTRYAIIVLELGRIF